MMAPDRVEMAERVRWSSLGRVQGEPGEKAEEEAKGAPRKALGAATSVFVEREPPHLGEIIRLGDPTVFIE